MIRGIPLALSVLLAGCGSDESASSGSDGLAMHSNPACSGEGPLEVRFTTSDDVELVADLHPAGSMGGPATILLHMNPGGNDNSNFPPAFIQALTDRTITVLNVNRRGAGGSGGDPTDAFEGPDGVRDAVAAQAFLVEHCRTNPGAIVLVGASNGTTTALDYTLESKTNGSVQTPRGLVFLSGGTYTENQHAIADHLSLLQPIPILFAHPDSEAAWNEAQQAHDTGQWTFSSYPGGEHGTGLFESNPASIGEVADFVGVALDVGMGW